MSSLRSLPRDLESRIRLGIVSVIMCSFAAFGLAALWFSEIPPFGWLFTTIVIITEELFLAMMAFFGGLLIWAITTPNWIDRVFHHARQKLWLVMVLGFLPIAVLMVLALLGIRLGEGLKP